MNSEFHTEFDALVEKFSELLTGSTSPELVEKIKIWSVYNHIHKTMPALASHWNQSHPESRAVIRSLYEEVRKLNLELKEKNQKLEEK
ncbi:YusU family protein [Paenibacillus radicis (ex Xue et al. 2023)]|uniref:YusU family protein n=1 Tax=Paenibacillus radicis (ex Xue et al. 2023) TaxID=2972489 RepID=A0ABT1YA39_9BACL|nr:YusU family protein [Paenibacillus radicis (ex Xue et al. 2023)]MCR8629757.1 YusU family protein [Paenibacillus radicis (ex Xue et al. 2023)]